MPKDAHGPGIEAVTPKLAGELGLAGHPEPARAPAARTPGCPSGRPPSGPFGTTGSGPRPATPAQQARPGPMSCPPPPCWRPACWPRWAASGGSSCGGGRSAAGSRVPTRTRRWPRRPCGSARTTPRCGCSTPACATCAGSSTTPTKTPPTVFAAHLGSENLDLWVAPPDPNPPRPVAGGRRRPGVAAAVRGHRRPRRPGTAERPGDRHHRPVPRPGVAGYQRRPAGSWSTWRWPTA